MSEEIVDYFRAMDEANRAERADNRESAADDYHAALNKARFYGVTLKRFSDVHHQLISVKPDWIMNVYPGNQRLLGDKNHKPPLIQLFRPWTLIRAVEAFGKKAQKVREIENDLKF